MTIETINQLLYDTVLMGTPIVFAALAVVICRNAGMFNMSVEGKMLVSALAGVAIAGLTKTWYFGLVGAVVFGTLMGAFIGYAHLFGKTNLYLTGVAFNLAAAGGTLFVMYLITGEKSNTAAAIKSYVVPKINIPIIEDIPILGPILSGHYVITYIAAIAIIAISVLLYKTRLGLRIRSIGENSDAAESVGISVRRIKYITFLISGALSGFGGAFMSMAYSGFFAKGMVNGRGWMGVSSANIGNGQPLASSLAALFFGFTDKLRLSLQSKGLPFQFINMIPYAATILALVIINIVRINRERAIERGKLELKK